MSSKGIRHLNSSGSGDQIVRVNIEVPKKVNSREKELLKELQKQNSFKKTSKADEKNFFKRFGF
jgi:molecular chaperone DnaJ